MNLQNLVLVGLVLGVLGLVSGSGMLTIYSDVDNLEQAEAQNLLDIHDERVVTYLEDTNFPRPSSQTQEIYVLANSGDPELVLLIDWEEHYVRDLTGRDRIPHEPDAVIDMPNATYHHLTSTIEAGIETGRIPRNGQLWLELLTASHISTRHGQDLLYRAQLAKWAIGRTAT